MCENFPLKVIWMKTRSFCMDIFLWPRYACIETGRVLGCGWHLKRWMASGRWSSEVKKRIPMEYLSGFFTTTGTKWYIKQKKKKFQNWDKRQKACEKASLMAQWYRICLPMQKTGVQSLVQYDATCHGATNSKCHNHWAHVPQLLKPMRPRASAPQGKPAQREACTHN